MILIILCSLLMNINSFALDINWYESNTNKDNSVLEVTCNNTQYQLVIKKKDIDNYIKIRNWFDMVNKKCKEF